MRKIYFGFSYRSFLQLSYLVVFSISSLTVFGQAVPELMYYKFNTAGATTFNTASAPVGMNPSPVTGLTIGGVGQFGSALIGNGGVNTSNNVNTGWPLNLGTGPWTISMWLNNFPATAATTQYFFGGAGGVTFRCFTGGVAGNNALMLRGTGITDVPVTAIGTAPVVIHFVHEVTPANVIKVYKNGVLANTVAQTSVSITGTDFWIGAYSGTTTSFPSGCLMDEFRMYNRALDATEIFNTWNIELGGPPTPCTTPPAPGTVTATVNPVCNGSNFSLYLTGGTSGTGQTYQWQSSPDNIIWTDISGATNASYSATQTGNTYYRALVTCSGNTAASASLLVTSSICYCTSIPTSAIDEEIFSVTLNGSTNAYNCTTVAPGAGSILNRYSNFYPLGALTTLIPGQTVSFTILEDECDGPTYYNSGCAIWIDFNQNGAFTDAGEQVYVENATTQSPRTITGNFVVPANAAPGLTGMRIIVAENFSGTGLQPCMTYTYGETEDYLVNIGSSTPCSGTPVAGSATSSVNSVCSSQTFNLSLNGSTLAAGLTYQWQKSSDSLNWANISGATNFTLTTSQTATTYYRSVVTCTNSSASSPSAGVKVVLLGGAPTPAISTSPADTVCAGTTVSLSTAACTGCTYTWNTGASTNNITVNTSSIYTIIVTNACGTGSASKEIVYNPSPSLSINGTNVICSGSSTTLVASGANSYTWSPATGLNTTSGPTVIASPTTTATYTVTGLIGTCSQAMSVTVTVNAIPSTPTVTASGTTTFCQGGTVTFTSSAAAGNQWYKDGNLIAGATNQTYAANAAGSYTVRVNANGCTSNASTAQTVTVNPTPPQPTITLNGNTMQSSAASGNQWFLNGSSISGATAQSYSTTANGLYSVQVTLNGCASPMSTTFVFSVTGIISPALDAKIRIAPNPVHDKLLIRYNGNPARFTIVLMSSNGAILSRGSFTTNYEFDFSKYSAGVYIISIINDKNGEKTRRLIVKE